MNPEQHRPGIEESLAMAAPALPPSLKARTLARCAEQSANRNRKGGRRLVWALAGVCAVQWLAVSLLNAQSAQLIAAATPTQSEGTIVMLERTPDVWTAMRERSEMLTTLMANRNEGPLSNESG